MGESAKMGVTPKIAPSMLSSDFANLASEAKYMMENGADWLHMDIMGLNSCAFGNFTIFFNISVLSFGSVSIASFFIWLLFERHFVPNLTIGAPVIQSLRKHTHAFLDCHLMVTNPLDYIEPFAKAGASGFTFHLEVTQENWQDVIKRVRNAGMRPAVALKPGTPVENVYPLVESEEPVEMVLIMTVEPGFGGQKFMPHMMDKVRDLRQKYPTLDIEVDGGLGPSTIDQAASAGANCIVAGSSVFGAKDPPSVIALLRKKC